ncbi:MAG: sulfite exporter TauE/SafE family protein [Gaiellaceae bacterium]
MTWELSLTGLLIGALVGLTGMGGGALLTPLLILLFGFKPTLAVGTDILHGAIFKSFGAARHRRLGTVHARLTFWMFLGSGPMSLVGVEVAVLLERHYGDGVESAGAKVIGAALLLGALGLVAKTFVRRGVQPDDAPFLLARRDRAIALALGAAGGFIVGLTSVGSGTFFALIMLLVFPLTAAKIVGTDIWHAAALLWVAGLSHLLHGNVDLGAMAWLLLGSIPGILLGSQVTVKLPERALRIGLATTLAVSGVKLLEPPATGPLMVAALVVGVVLLVLAELQRLDRCTAAFADRR